jgi:hypothetical protein
MSDGGWSSGAWGEAGWGMSVYDRSITESTVVVEDFPPAVGSAYLIDMNESVQAAEAFVAMVVFITSVSEGITVSDQLTARPLWDQINDSQPANWQNINNAQPSNWQNINDAQPSNWQDVATT